MEDKTNLTTRAAWLILGKTLAFVFAFALPLLLVRRLSQFEFGLYKQVFLFVTTMTMLLPLGFHMSAYYFLPREPAWGRQIVLNILLFEAAVTTVACVIIVLWPSLLATLFKSDEMGRLGPLIALAVLTFVISALLDHMALALGESKLATAFVVTSQLLRTLLLLGAAIVFGTVKSLVYASIIFGTLQSLVLFFYLRSRFFDFWRSFDWAIMRQQLAYALPLGLAAELWMLQTTLDNFFVSYVFGPAAYAIYAIGCFQLPLVVILTESLGLTTIPRVSQLQKEGRTREIVELLARMMRKQAAIFLPLFLFLLVVGREFIVLLFTRQYLASWPIFAINLALVPLAIITSATDPVMRAYSEHRYFLLKLRIGIVALLALALWYGTGRYGLIGAISIMAIVNVIQAGFVVVKTARILPVGRGDWSLLKDIGKIALASIAAAIVTFGMRSVLLGTRPLIILALCGTVFGLVYFVMLLIMRTATTEEREVCRRVATRLQHQLFLKRTSPAL